MISAVVLTKNEEKNIKNCLESLSWCDEIIVVDDNSTDNTVIFANKYGALVYQRSLNQDFANQRNYGLKEAKNEWILFVDADEIVTFELQGEIKNAVRDNLTDGFLIKRQDVMWGKVIKHGESANISLLRLGKKENGKWIGKVHEAWEMNGKVSHLTNPLIHYPHQSINEFLKEINFYTDIRARELFEKSIKSNFFSIIFYPKAKFIQNYFLKLGILDGLQGLILAILMSFHSFLVRSKLWLLWRNKSK